MDNSYWQKQISGQPLFPDVLWSKPERRDLAGNLVIIGGNSHGFAAIAAAYQSAYAAGVGNVRVILPDILKKTLPAAFTAQITDLIFAPTNPSGGFAAESLSDWLAAADWADEVLFIGDSGANSETAALLETFLQRNKTANVTLTRDAVDLIKNAAESVLTRPNTHFVTSFSQLQKLFRAVYYPRVLTFSQGPRQIAESLHKFTLSFNQTTISLWHANQLFASHNGNVITTEFSAPMRVWSGEVATRNACWSIWEKSPLKAIATSWIDN